MSDLTDPDAWWGHYSRAYVDRSWRDSRALLADTLRHAPSGPIVDVGCGYGFLVEAARRFGIESVGFEGSPAAVREAARRHPLADVRHWLAGSPLPLPPSSVGAVVLNEVVDHFSMDANTALFKDVTNILLPGGVTVVRSPSRHNRFDDDLGHVSFFSPREFRAFVESFGLRVVEQPFSPQPIFGTSRLGRLAARALALAVDKEWIAARIDLVAEKASGTA